MTDKIQAILFKKKYWTPDTARDYMDIRNYKPIKRVHITENYLRYRLKKPKKNADYITRPSKRHPSVKYVVEI